MVSCRAAELWLNLNGAIKGNRTPVSALGRPRTTIVLLSPVSLTQEIIS
jgi:hypothetical protein